MVWNVLVVEDDLTMREYLAASIMASEDLALAGTACNCTEAWVYLKNQESKLDVMLVDIGLPDGSGIDLIRMAKDIQPQCESMVISVFGDDKNVSASIEAGALGYIHKDSQPENIVKEIKSMKAGASPISPMIARRLLERFEQLSQPTNSQQPSPDNSNIIKLTDREDQVLQLIGDCKNNCVNGILLNLIKGTTNAYFRQTHRPVT
jgi:DNA-binding NarL/FixJ family response regulator